MKNFLSYAAGVLTAILILYCISNYYYPIGISTTVEIVGEVASPDGVYLATTKKASNTGGWCELRTNVYKKGETYDWEREYVTIAGCDTELKFTWQGNRSLLVNYYYNKDGEATVSRQTLSKDKEVSISYSLIQ